MPTPGETLAQFASRAFGRRTIRHAIQTSNVARARSPRGSVKMAGEANRARLAAMRSGIRPGSISGMGKSGRRPSKPSIPLAGRSPGRSGISGSGAGRRLPQNPANLGPDPAPNLDPALGRSQSPTPRGRRVSPRPAPTPRATPTPPSRQPRARRAPRRTSQTSSARRTPRTTRNLLGLRN